MKQHVTMLRRTGRAKGIITRQAQVRARHGYEYRELSATAARSARRFHSIGPPRVEQRKGSWVHLHDLDQERCHKDNSTGLSQQQDKSGENGRDDSGKNSSDKPDEEVAGGAMMVLKRVVNSTTVIARIILMMARREPWVMATWGKERAEKKERGCVSGYDSQRTWPGTHD